MVVMFHVVVWTADTTHSPTSHFGDQVGINWREAPPIEPGGPSQLVPGAAMMTAESYHYSTKFGGRVLSSAGSLCFGWFSCTFAMTQCDIIGVLHFYWLMVVK